MYIQLDPGTYVAAVSGGIDSMVLLHLLMQKVTSNKSSVASDKRQETGDNVRLIVAHFEHGIRTDSHEDLDLVHKTATRYDLPFVFDYGNLGPKASEATAREARYKFLRRVKQVSQSAAIITAHHQDDVLETAILNMMRGTGPRGLTSLKSTNEIVRPLLDYSKKDILDYAIKQKIIWHEDSTNLDERYRRNEIRAQLMPKLSPSDRQQLSKLIADAHKRHQEIDDLLPDVSKKLLDRQMIIALPHIVAKEVIAAWLKHHKIQDISQQKIEKLVIACKTYEAGKKTDLDNHWVVTFSKNNLALEARER